MLHNIRQGACFLTFLHLLFHRDFSRKPMASALGNRVGSVRNSLLLRSPLNFMRALSTSSSSTSSSISSGQSPKKSKRRKKKNLFEVAQFLPNWGIGYHMAKTHWNEVSYEITKLNLYKVLLFLSSTFFLVLLLFWFGFQLFQCILQWFIPLLFSVLASLFVLNFIFQMFLQDGRHGKAWGIAHKNG